MTKKIIQQCINRDIKEINHVYFVLSVNNGFTADDAVIFTSFTDTMRIKNKISLILSFGQDVTPEKSAHFWNQFIAVPELRSIYNKTEGRIFFLGAVQQDEFTNMEATRNNVEYHRQKVLNHIIQQKHSFKIQQTPNVPNGILGRIMHLLNISINYTCPDDEIPPDNTRIEEIRTRSQKYEPESIVRNSPKIPIRVCNHFFDKASSFSKTLSEV